MEFKDSLNLPDAAFTIPMKADLATREPAMQADWDAKQIYHRIQKSREGRPTFVLHDGPPYTNGPIHIGTAMNKVLKDFVVKSRTLMGFQAPYVPGYDNHGLPIEQAVSKALAEQKITPDITTLRQACRTHAQKYIGVQTEQFKRLGIFGLWEDPYATMTYRYEAEIVRTFKRLVEEGQVYRGLRPVMWSPTCQTALADTEIVYEDYVSTSIFVRFPCLEPERFPEFANLYTIIWTTTPWTIPANVAVAYHPDLLYGVYRVGSDHYVLYVGLAEKVFETCGITGYEQVGTLQGSELEHVRFKHPIFDRDSVGVLADYVTTEDGTGVVHTAPGHGREDFYTGLRYNLQILCPVNDKGVMTSEAGEFEGLYYLKANEAVVNRLREVGALLASGEHHHSYPHAERDNKPVIFRTTDQWFVSIDANDLRSRLQEQISNVTWYPASGEKRIRAMTANRPDWCISRQRPWGVGIPVFYGADSHKPILDPVAIEAVAKLIEAKGSDAWFTEDPASILPEGYKHPETGETEFTKETDVFDVWFDSGATNFCVLEGNVNPNWPAVWPADVYLEGSDQHRGWFNVSLILGTAIKGQAPFKEVVTHGFVMDGKMQKMSKRFGNVIDPVTTSNQYGADILRYWVASVKYEDDVPCSDEILKQCGEQYRTVRNTLRFLLSNLYDYQGGSARIENDLDQWLVEQVDLLVADCWDGYQTYEFGRAISAIHNFCTNEVSRFYGDTVKDRLYCDAPDWPSRRSAQEACFRALLALTKLIAPILPHTAEEVYARIPMEGKLESVHMEELSKPEVQDIAGNQLQQRVASLLSIRAQVFAELEQWKAQSGVKDSRDVVISFQGSNEDVKALNSFGLSDLATIFKVAWVNLAAGDPGVTFNVTDYLQCQRSLLRRPDCAEIEVKGEKVVLSERDRKVLGL